MQRIGHRGQIEVVPGLLVAEQPVGDLPVIQLIQRGVGWEEPVSLIVVVDVLSVRAEEPSGFRCTQDANEFICYDEIYNMVVYSL